ncbi:hypothetical protein IC617_01090 [Neiella sp. HB171785]|uniref:Uncharacterized protein n=1 Tax=Neiella litorisoli TaxID=2771431 RepID=A0A8J6QED8_9GAMM|nr:hypothetical protein [Neiella litorisoli]MBD1388014.1 hypothetical protein [Neiella litorisoli]
MLKANTVLLSWALLISGAAANAADWQAEWQLCASVKNDQQRLLCYDRIGARYGLTGSGAAKTISQEVQQPADSSALASAMVPAEQSQAAAVVAGSTPAPSVVTVDSSPEEQFGLEQKIIKQELDKIDAIDAVITDLSKDAYGKLTLSLDNNQRWKLQSTGPKFAEGDKVVIERGAFGAFYVRKDGAGRKTRAKRLE